MNLQQQAVVAAAADGGVAVLCLVFIWVCRDFHEPPARRRAVVCAALAAAIAVVDGLLRLGAGTVQAWYLPVYGLMLVLIGYVLVLHGSVLVRRLLECRAADRREAERVRRVRDLQRRFNTSG